MKMYASASNVHDLKMAKHLGYSHALVSFADNDAGQVIGARRAFKGILLDSGAFSVASGRVRIELDEYIETCRVLEGVVDAYANLDVIGDHVATARNQRRMEQAGLRPLPTFHFGSPWEVLRDLVLEYPYVGIGGIAKMRGGARMKWLETAWATIMAARWPVRTHGWGVTSSEALERFPWYSVDSTSWMRGKTWGACDFRRGMSLVGVPRKKLVGMYGGSSRGSYLLRMRKSALARIAYVEELTRIWTLRGVTWDERSPTG